LRKGRLRVARVTTAKYFLPRMLGDFCRRYPEIEIELEVANRARIVERMRGNLDDLYIMSFPRMTWTSSSIPSSTTRWSSSRRPASRRRGAV
jgi:DNA-binding transcriptional LysR family regulator